MDDGARGWLIKTANANFWRVSKWYELDDLIQDGYLCYYKVKSKYPTATDAPHQMALFKVTYINFIHDLATSRTRAVVEVLDTDLGGQGDDGPEGSILANTIECPLGGLAEFAAFASKAPQRVREVLKLFASNDGFPALRSAYRHRRVAGSHLVRETTNERLCRILGYDSNAVNLIAELRAFLQTTS